MKTSIMIIIGIFTAAMMAMPVTLRADPAQTTAYEACVEKYIARADKQKDLMESRSEALRMCGREAQEKAEFYRANKDLLIRAMEAEHVRPSEPHVNYFLIKAYHSATASESQK